MHIRISLFSTDYIGQNTNPSLAIFSYCRQFYYVPSLSGYSKYLKLIFMKIRFIFSFCCLVAIQSFATIRTVSNNPASIAQFGTIQAAINVSSSGDTVYVHGSTERYTAFNINNKALVIVGPGFNPNKELPYSAVIVGATVIGPAGTAGTEIQGMYFDRSNSSQLYVQNDSIRFVRNMFSCPISYSGNDVFIGTTCNNVLWEGNCFLVSEFSMNANIIYSNWLFQNNLFYPPGIGGGLFRSLAKTSNFLFNHNLMYSCTGLLYPIVHDANNSGGIVFTNNILMRMNLTSSMGATSYSNNITFECNNNEPWLLGGNANGGGNIANTSPQLVSQAQVNACNFIFSDLSVAAGPAKNAGSDGKDIGLLFDAIGPYNWANSGNSRLPRISKMSVLNTTVQQGATITISVQAKTSN